MAVFHVIVLLGCSACVVISRRLGDIENINGETQHIQPAVPRLWKRFINPSLTAGDFTRNGASRLRTKRESEDDCEKLQLCKLHAKSGRNFFAAYELYFVNKENAKLWDHRSHTVADCEERFSGCYQETHTHPQKHTEKQQVEFIDEDYER